MKHFFSILMLALLFGLSVFLSSCAIEGPIGPAGPTGQTGEDGQDGDKGDPGLPGADAQGNIISDTTWTAANGPYVLEKNIVVKSGVTLTLEPSASINLNPNTIIYIDGTLDAQGTASNHILFKKEGSVGGGEIYFSSTSTDSILRYCELQDNHFTLDANNVDIQYCKFINSTQTTGTPAIFNPNFNLIALNISNCTFIGNNNSNSCGVYVCLGGFSGTLNNCIIQSFQRGIFAENSNLTITNSSVVAFSLFGISTITSTINITNSNIYGNSDIYYYNQNSADQIATNNYWGTTTEIESKIYDHNDNPSFGTVDYSGYLSDPVTVSGCGW